MTSEGQSENSCPLCDFDDRNVIIADDDYVFAIISENPINPYHVLVVPKEHYESFNRLPDFLASHLFLLAKRLSAAVRQASQAHAITHLSDDGVSWGGFDLVPHYKLHIIPRFKGDGTPIVWHRQSNLGSLARTQFADAVRSALQRQARKE
ncbi:MAG: HIT family protein [Gammaproteobacteria bacterium]|nr:HIT family protein [Gammaproteobacteria bacterium]